MPLSSSFLSEFKHATEEKWSNATLVPYIHGFQIQQNTRWNAGLSEQEIDQYQSELGVTFPNDFRKFLGAMNGTDLPTLNIYGYRGEPFEESEGVYSFPRDLATVKEYINRAQEDREEITKVLEQQGFDLPQDAGLVPIYGHRYVVCADPVSSVVLSICDEDAIVYNNSLEEYLTDEFLKDDWAEDDNEQYDSESQEAGDE